MPDNSGAYDLGGLSHEEQERLNEMADQAPDQPDEGSMRQGVMTAFTVHIDWEGRVHVTDYDGQKYAPANQPNNDNLTMAAAVIQKDMIVAEAAQHTVQVQMMMAAQAQQQMEAQRIAQATQGGLDLSHIRGGH